MNTRKTVIVLGGGIGGITVAGTLRKKLPKAHRVILVEREPHYQFAPSFPWLMVERRKPDQISRPMTNTERHGFELVQGDIQKIDPQRRSVEVNGETLQGDYMVISLGAELDPSLVPGLAEAGHDFYTLEGAKTFSQARKQVTDGTITVLVSAMPFKCPAAPYEAALLIEADLKKRGIREKVNVELHTPEPCPLPVAGERVSADVRKMLDKRNVRYHTQHKVKSAYPDAKTLQFEDGTEARYDLLAYVPPHRAPQVVKDAGLLGESGWIPVEPGSMRTKYDNVFAIGDVTGIMLKVGKPLPKAGVFAHRQGEAVAKTIAHDITGKGKQEQFDGFGQCFVEVGHMRAGTGFGNFYAEPVPTVKFRRPTWFRHMGKVAFEKYWLHQWY